MNIVVDIGIIILVIGAIIIAGAFMSIPFLAALIGEDGAGPGNWLFRMVLDREGIIKSAKKNLSYGIAITFMGGIISAIGYLSSLF